MEKNLKMTLQNCLLSFYENGELHPCRLYFYNDHTLKIQKSSFSPMEHMPKKQSTISQDGISFNLKIHINLKFNVSMRKIHLQNLGVQKVEIVILNKESDEQLRLYVPKSSQNYQKLYNFFKTCCFLNNFSHFFEIHQMVKLTSQRLRTQYLIVQQKATSKTKMVKRYFKQELDFNSKVEILKQIQIQNKLNCPGVIKLEGFFEDNQFIYLVYNEIPTKSLKQFIKTFKTFEKTHVKVIIKQLLQAALELQINGIVHNNIQPSTVQLINENQNWKSCLNHFSDAILTSQWNQQALNQMNKYYGYSSPEVLNPLKGKLSSKSDVFSIGAVFYFALFGKNLFKLNNQINHAYIDSYPEIDFGTEEMKSLSFETLQLLKKMLEFNPDKRISIIEALTHRYFTTRQQSASKSPLRESTTRSRSKTPNKKKHNSMVRTQNYNPTALQLKENTNPLYETLGNPPTEEKKEKKMRLKFSNTKKKSYFKMEEDGEIDSDDIDDSHISLEPRNLSRMAPSYELKKNIEFKFFTV